MENFKREQLQAIRSPECNRRFVEPTSVPILPELGLITGQGVPRFREVAFQELSPERVSVWCSIVLRTGGGQDGRKRSRRCIATSMEKSLGRFFIRNAYREGLEDVLNHLNKHNFRRLVLTGDHPERRCASRQLFG